MTDDEVTAEDKTEAFEVAEWMLSEVMSQRYLSQDDASFKIEKTFGPEYTYQNENGNLAIDKRVLKEFRRISRDIVVWSRSEKSWEQRKPHHSPGRQQP